MNRTSLWIAPCLGVALVSASCSSGGGGSGAGGNSGSSGGSGSSSGAAETGVCGMLESYKATVTTPYSFATDIYPIISNESNCATAAACHGSPSIFIDKAGTVRQSFADPASTVYTLLMSASVIDPAMPKVTPGNVGQSFLAYKLTAGALSCANLKCTVPSFDSTAAAPCGLPMPESPYVITSAQTTEILDWIAQGAKM